MQLIQHTKDKSREEPPQIEHEQSQQPLNLNLKPLKHQIEFSREITKVNTRAIVAQPDGRLKIANTDYHVTPFTDYEIEKAKSIVAIQQE